MPQVALAEFLAAVQAGELVSFPTDTVPALATRPEAGDRIYQLKQRSQTKPLILMAASLQDLLPYVTGTEGELAAWTALAERYWPGALTLVLPASDRLPAAMNPERTGTLGIRVPAHPLARYLLAHTGPLATTSVNRSGQPPLETMAAIQAQFPAVITLTEAALEELYARWIGSPPPAADHRQGSGQPSTVAAWTGQGWQVLRQGSITLDAAVP
ncbi:MAG TPA: L-threonylcarbamoyladenylate synthase [Leptolyngbyaceae cyanobacterium M65_K2018_010]|nr:L-threonylcarbamoyladenylate synthase [Leptolyngbyaceae cyanobacterium M65_K2018_010]